MAFQPITGSASSPDSWVFPILVFVQGNDQRMMNLDHTPFTVGRKVDKDLVVADPRVSRDHALITSEDGQFCVVDQGRRTLNQAAWAAVRTKNTYFAARFHRLAAKRGSKRAIVAIGHKILVLAHYLLQHDRPFRELGGDYYQKLRAPGLSHSLVRRLQRLGYQVTLTPATQPM